MPLKSATAVLLAALLLPAARAQTAPSDDAQRQVLTGFWILSPDHPNANLEQMKARGVFPVLQLNADGTGAFNIHGGSICGPVQATLKMNWSIADGILVESMDLRARHQATHDKIVSLDATNLVLASLEKGTTEYEVRVPDCPAP